MGLVQRAFLFFTMWTLLVVFCIWVALAAAVLIAVSRLSSEITAVEDAAQSGEDWDGL